MEGGSPRFAPCPLINRTGPVSSNSQILCKLRTHCWFLVGDILKVFSRTFVISNSGGGASRMNHCKGQ